MATQKKAGAKDEMPFEAVMANLEQIVEKLEDGALGLEESLRAYEAGVALVRQAQGRLDAMDERLEQLNADGTISSLAGEDASADDDDDGEADDDDAPF